MLADFQTPPFIIVGTFDGEHNTASREWSKILFNIVHLASKDQCQMFCTTMGEAAMVKLASNTFHALKVSFANEVGRICHEQGIDSQKMMNLFVQDRKLNISDCYLRPAFAFGGTCLGKDTYGLLLTAKRQSGNKYPLIGSIETSNITHIEEAEKLIKSLVKKTGQNTIGFFGLTFKVGTDDLRLSPAVELINRLPKSYPILAIDSDLRETPDLTGKNRDHWIKMLSEYKIAIANSIEEITSECRILVIAKPITFNLETLKLSNQHCLIDLTGEISLSQISNPANIYKLV